ncbi:MAG: DMT family transporter [Pseudomonadota bacterium]
MAENHSLQWAIGFVLLANLLFAMVDSSTKWLIGAGLTVLQLAFLRYAVHFAITLAERAGRGRGVGLPRRTWSLVAFRAFCLVSATIVNFFALGQLPLAITASILYLSPVLVCIFAHFLLQEDLTPTRIFAVVIGFLGVLIIFNPLSEDVHWYALLMLYPAAAMALYLVLTRRLASEVSPHRMQLATGAIGTVALLPVGIVGWSAPGSAFAAGLALSIGVFAWAGHEVLTRAHRLSEASLLAPFGYSFVIYLVLAGWLAFSEIPKPTTLIGAAFVITAGLVVHRG